MISLGTNYWNLLMMVMIINICMLIIPRYRAKHSTWSVLTPASSGKEYYYTYFTD